MPRQFGDKEVIESIERQDHMVNEVLRFLYKSHFKSIKALILSLGGNNEDVSDVFQEAIIVTYNAILERTFAGKSSLGTFLYAVARNSWLKTVRKRRNITSAETGQYEKSILDQEIEVEVDNTQLLHKMIGKLGNDCRTILLDFYFNKLSMGKIMEKFNLGSEQAAKNKKYRCMKQLMTLCKENGLTKESELSE